jgi:hypothetical protein
MPGSNDTGISCDQRIRRVRPSLSALLDLQTGRDHPSEPSDVPHILKTHVAQRLSGRSDPSTGAAINGFATHNERKLNLYRKRRFLIM